MDTASDLFTRRQLGSLAGLDDTTLNYWSREGLLIPTDGGKGRGSHRKFDFVQVNIAAILGQMRFFGLNIGVLRSFAEVLQEAAELGAARELHPGNYRDAARLATELHRFRAGKEVMVSKYWHDADPPPGVSRADYSEWLLAKRPAGSEAEVIRETISIDHDSLETVLAVAEAIGPGRETVAHIYGDLVYDVLVPGYAGAYSWLLGFDAQQKWRIEFGSEGAKFFDRIDSTSPEEFGPGIFLPVSGIIRKTWRLKTPTEYSRERTAERLRLRLAEAGITATVAPDESRKADFTIDALDAEWERVDAVLARLSYVSYRPADRTGAAR